MIAYAASTRTRRNIAALDKAGWRLLITPGAKDLHEHRGYQFRYGIDNGAFSEGGFQPKPFLELVERRGQTADFIVLPDIVAGGKASLDLSVSWIPKLRGYRSLLLPLQDGMTAYDVGLVLRQNVQVGLFLGGSTEFKLREIYAWGMVAHAWKRWYHVGRVNTARRIRLAHEAGADSFDGKSATMFSCTIPLLDAANAQPSLLSPRLIA